MSKGWMLIVQILSCSMLFGSGSQEPAAPLFRAPNNELQRLILDPIVYPTPTATYIKAADQYSFYRWDKATDRWSRFSWDLDSSGNLAVFENSRVARTSDGESVPSAGRFAVDTTRVFWATDQGIAVFDTVTKQAELIRYPTSLPRAFVGHMVVTNNVLHILIHNFGLANYDLASHRYTLFPLPDNQLTWVKNVIWPDCRLINPEVLFIEKSGRGVAKLDLETGVLSELITDSRLSGIGNVDGDRYQFGSVHFGYGYPRSFNIETHQLTNEIALWRVVTKVYSEVMFGFSTAEGKVFSLLNYGIGLVTEEHPEGLWISSAQGLLPNKLIYQLQTDGQYTYIIYDHGLQIIRTADLIDLLQKQGKPAETLSPISTYIYENEAFKFREMFKKYTTDELYSDWK